VSPELLPPKPPPLLSYFSSNSTNLPAEPIPRYPLPPLPSSPPPPPLPPSLIVCGWYTNDGYSCAGDYCSAMDLDISLPVGEEPSDCATPAPSLFVVHEETGKCVPPDWDTGMCFSGSVSETGQEPCVPFTAGTFVFSSGSTTCSACPEGLWSAEGASSCSFMRGPVSRETKTVRVPRLASSRAWTRVAPAATPTTEETPSASRRSSAPRRTARYPKLCKLLKLCWA